MGKPAGQEKAQKKKVWHTRENPGTVGLTNLPVEWWDNKIKGSVGEPQGRGEWPTESKELESKYFKFLKGG